MLMVLFFLLFLLNQHDNISEFHASTAWNWKGEFQFLAPSKDEIDPRIIF